MLIGVLALTLDDVYWVDLKDYVQTSNKKDNG